MFQRFKRYIWRSSGPADLLGSRNSDGSLESGARRSSSFSSHSEGGGGTTHGKQSKRFAPYYPGSPEGGSIYRLFDENQGFKDVLGTDENGDEEYCNTSGGSGADGDVTADGSDLRKNPRQRPQQQKIPIFTLIGFLLTVAQTLVGLASRYLHKASRDGKAIGYLVGPATAVFLFLLIVISISRIVVEETFKFCASLWQSKIKTSPASKSTPTLSITIHGIFRSGARLVGKYLLAIIAVLITLYLVYMLFDMIGLSGMFWSIFHSATKADKLYKINFDDMPFDPLFHSHHHPAGGGDVSSSNNSSSSSNLGKLLTLTEITSYNALPPQFGVSCRDLTPSEIMSGRSHLGTDLPLMMQAMCEVMHNKLGCQGPASAVLPRMLNATALVALFLNTQGYAPLHVDRRAPAFMFSKGGGGGAAGLADSRLFAEKNDEMVKFSGISVETWGPNLFVPEDLCILTYKDTNGICFHYLNMANRPSPTLISERLKATGGRNGAIFSFDRITDLIIGGGSSSSSSGGATGNVPKTLKAATAAIVDEEEEVVSSLPLRSSSSSGEREQSLPLPPLEKKEGTSGSAAAAVEGGSPPSERKEEEQEDDDEIDDRSSCSSSSGGGRNCHNLGVKKEDSNDDGFFPSIEGTNIFAAIGRTAGRIGLDIMEKAQQSKVTSLLLPLTSSSSSLSLGGGGGEKTADTAAATAELQKQAPAGEFPSSSSIDAAIAASPPTTTATTAIHQVSSSSSSSSPSIAAAASQSVSSSVTTVFRLVLSSRLFQFLGQHEYITENPIFFEYQPIADDTLVISKIDSITEELRKFEKKTTSNTAAAAATSQTNQELQQQQQQWLTDKNTELSKLLQEYADIAAKRMLHTGSTNNKGRGQPQTGSDPWIWAVPPKSKFALSGTSPRGMHLLVVADIARGTYFGSDTFIAET